MKTLEINFEEPEKQSGPVKCLGQTFPNDTARREHFLAILREKLQDPEFRKIEGFPIGTDEDILALSDPPYYTACPNPFIGDFIAHYGTPYDPAVPYSKEPFAADVSEGKNDPIYNAHSYHTKVPHKAIMRYILHYTQPGDVVFDGFCGTGMTGVAAQLCGDRRTVESLGYKVLPDGQILAQDDEGGNQVWKPFSRLGARRAILNDLSPAATFIAYNYNTPVDVHTFEREAKRILAEVEEECGWMYETLHTDGKTKGRINYIVWSDVFTCPECAGEIIFWNVAIDREAGEVREKFHCPHCDKKVSKGRKPKSGTTNAQSKNDATPLERTWTTKYDEAIQANIKQAKQVPVFISYSVGKQKFEKKPDDYDKELIEKIENSEIPYEFPVMTLPDGYNTRQPIESHGTSHIHHFYTKRNLWVISAFVNKCDSLTNFSVSKRLMFTKTASERITSKLASIAFSYFFHGGGGFVNAGRKGTLYISSVVPEVPAYLSFKSRCDATGFSLVSSQESLIASQSSSDLRVPSDSLDYLFFDPPFGANINYSELNFIWEAWLGAITNNKPEAIENKVQGKSLDHYRRLMVLCFSEAFRVLKPGRWITVEFSNTQASVWNAIQTAIQEAGFVVANVSVLDKKQNSILAYTTPTAVKQDLVISAYKPNGGLEDRFSKSGGSEESAWDFVRTHLKYLPTLKLKSGQLEFIPERDPRILFDRMVAWFMRHGFPVPLSSQEFQAGLKRLFDERDGMVFLPDQTAEYDKKRQQTAQAPQMELFICDERSAIDWLTDFLKRRPSTYQEIHPEFISQLGAGWKKHEAKPELSALLESNFLKCEAKGGISTQIVSWMKQSAKLREIIAAEIEAQGADAETFELKTQNPELLAKAEGRWYVPDPNKARDLEMIREKALLKEFENYRTFTGRRLKEFRLEVMRAGFKNAFANKDYPTIITIAEKLPEEALQEDEKLLTLYDLALTRMETQS